MFANMHSKTPWNIDGPLLWGYFFFDRDMEKLKGAATELQSLGYRIVNLEAVQDRPLFKLHVERIEAHTPESLNLRNMQFYEFAEKRAIGSYDGMDVGPVPKAAP
ncbi:ribonuclease E inhibitor RraB [Polaromonas sp.]|uniref:ribonuclease E inhibitor RraB n=1 Tax=Polaromonas sp. TaxID=1869339 RepID=UPI0032634506